MSEAESTAGYPDPELRRTLRLRDLVPMQVLLVVGITSVGMAARLGPSYVFVWLAGILMMFLPSAGVIQYAVRLWPLEGGVYQWTRNAISPLAGFLSAWNFGIWTLLTVSPLGITVATALSYALGPSAHWMSESGAFIASINIGLFLLILLINVPGLGTGRWVAHFGTAVMLLVSALLTVLLLYDPAAHLQRPRPYLHSLLNLTFPPLDLFTLNLFTKIAFISLTGLEQVAVFAGETREPGRTILRSAWLAAPLIGLIYILITASMLTYTSADKIDLTGPIPQLLAAAFGPGASGTGSPGPGWLIGRAVIVALAAALFAQCTVYIAELSRLPMVAAWDHLMPSWFTRLHPRYRTPTHSIALMVAMAILLGLLASAGAGTQEAYQLMIVTGNFCYAIYYLMMFAVPLVVGTRFGRRPSPLLRLGCLCGMSVTALYMIFALVPIVEVKSPWLFALKVFLATVLVNLLGIALYRKGAHRAMRAQAPLA